MRLSQCPFASSLWKANSALCTWEFGVGSKSLALPPSGSRSLLDVILEPGPTLYLILWLLPFPSSGGLLPESGVVG